jgi:porin
MLSAVGYSRSNLFKGLVLGLTCTTTLPALADNDADLLTRSTLSGDWGGLRHQMDEQGIKFTGDYSGETVYNAHGGKQRGTRYSQNIKLGAQFDLGKLLTWKAAARSS